ncbi:MAG: acyl-protein synthetase [Oscillospiraceae bacterium]|nr:acyl-protein synthetase [Oscillospiraceae bacterium]
MKYRGKLFRSRKIYDLKSTDKIFLEAMKSNIDFHVRHCPEYRDILEVLDFDKSVLRSTNDLHKLPPLPTSYLKNHTLTSKPYDKFLLKTSSSGTGGKKTLSGFDVSSAFWGLCMLLKIFKYHNLLSLRRTNYIILGYQPDKSNQTAMAKALKGITFLAPQKGIAYALKVKNGEYYADIQGLVDSLLRFSKQNHPVRIVGFPAYMKMFIDELNERGIKITLHKNSKMLLGGGWKTFFAEEISKDKLFSMVSNTLGVRRENFKDHFSTAEHPINYVACENGNFHIPVFSRVIIRDVNTLERTPNDTPGLLNLITPLLSSVPFGSIMTDDIAVMRDAGKCGCKIPSPHFELIGRVGLASIKTCTQAASDYLKNI